MANSTEYMTFRYSIIKESQMHMYAKELPETKGKISNIRLENCM